MPIMVINNLFVGVKIVVPVNNNIGQRNFISQVKEALFGPHYSSSIQ